MTLLPTPPPPEGAGGRPYFRNQQTLEGWLATLSNRRGQITNTIYDLPYPGFVGLGDPRMVITQRNLRNRVSYTTLTDTGATNVYSQGTFYTYDILGNVDELLQDYGYGGSPGIPNLMNQRGNRWKKIRYQYDLISGKVNMVIYQPGYRDAFFHRYSYDAENRLTLVETSPDSLVWEKDARYEYYRHGPLARVTLGEQQVQGLDYAYTLQGWLKGINSSGGVETYDMGEDGKAGSLNQYTARDAIGLTLNYFTNDYSALNGHPFPGSSGKLNGNDRPLYNGNISSSSVYQKKFEGETGGPLIFYNYKYDQLNRLTRQDAFEGIYNAGSGYWDTLKTMGERLKERIAYDANGNILKYLRNSIKPNQVKMDSLNYYYYPNTNQLRRIRDTVSDNLFYDPENQIVDINGQPDSNYVYDSIGNLIEDKQEKITSIKWNVYGKIEEINRLATDTVPASNIKYTYDAMGNRISQVVTSNGTRYYTWYVRDAQGNILSTYTAQGNSSPDSLELQLADRFIYGSSRLGTITINDNNVNGGPGNTEYYYENRLFAYDRGHKSYELANHLGNVLATVSDRKFAVPSDTSSLIDHYEPHIVTAQDYYPFGMLSRVALPNNNKSYRFGFNGKMNDNDVKGGLGNQQDYGFRIYDPRIGKFLSVDPISNEYPWYSPYHFAGNTPVNAKDLDGLEPAYPYMDSKGQWRESKGAENNARKNLPSGHLQFLRNSSSMPNEQQLREQWASSLNFVPVIGQIKSLSEGFTGKEWFTGRKLTSLERKLAILPIRVGSIAAQEVRAEVRALASEEGAIARSSETATSAGSEIATEIPGRVQSRINIANGRTRFTPLKPSNGQIGEAGFDHVIKRHFDKPIANNLSIFTVSKEELKVILQSKPVVSSPVISIAGGQFQRTVDAGVIVGQASLKQGGQNTSWMKVFTDKAGNLISTFPIANPNPVTQ